MKRFKGLGIGVYDALVRDIYDPEYNITYPPLSCCNDEIFAARCTDRDAPKVIWAIQATGQFNNDMYLALRDGFRQDKIKLLTSENDFYELPRGIVQAILDDAELKRKLLLLFIHTTLFINEIIVLKYTPTGTLIKVKEQVCEKTECRRLVITTGSFRSLKERLSPEINHLNAKTSDKQMLC